MVGARVGTCFTYLGYFEGSYLRANPQRFWVNSFAYSAHFGAKKCNPTKVVLSPLGAGDSPVPGMARPIIFITTFDDQGG